jgi:hypothetical protein
MEVIMQTDHGAGLAIAAIALDHFSALRKPLTPVGLHEETPLIAVDIGIDDVDAANEIGFGDCCHKRGGAFRLRRMVNLR